MIYDPNGPYISLILDMSCIANVPRTSLILNISYILDASLISNAYLSSMRGFTRAHKYAKV